MRSAPPLALFGEYFFFIFTDQQTAHHTTMV